MMTSQTLSWQQLNESISLKREELRQLEGHAAFMRDSAIATARNILRAYDISIDELNSSIADDANAARTVRDSGRKVRRVTTPRPVATEQDEPPRESRRLLRLRMESR
ncbi:hypothetical protein, partial [Ideonella sp.]|uniref:hypothetical protein n=1 Tax=Ideonella sp. TaxID=1929293 RepID=UPI0035B32F14